MLQAGQDNAQTHIALFKIGNGGHHLLIGGVVAGLVQLTGQICQLLSVGGVVTHHILHQGGQLLHGGVLALGRTGAAAALAVVVVVMVVLVIVDMLMGMGHTVMGVLVGVRMVVVMRKTGMIVIEMHRNQSPFNVFYIIIPNKAGVKTFIFHRKSPRGACL